ncbi:hypothetical protein FJZ31_05125 [Candidatus Poribacteria bacterium]|nr:hypothetical protein [Candidatus Poribacteria bacterium]
MKVNYPDPLKNPGEAFGGLEEKQYKAELDLVERYQVFVAELLRLSLAGIGVFGFLYLNIFKDPSITDSEVAKWLAALGVIAFSLCTASALFFRFFATEGARYYIEALRFAPGQLNCVDRAQNSLNIRYQRIIVCKWSKALAAFFLGLGSILIAIAFYLLLMYAPPQGSTG